MIVLIQSRYNRITRGVTNMKSLHRTNTIVANRTQFSCSEIAIFHVGRLSECASWHTVADELFINKIVYHVYECLRQNVTLSLFSIPLPPRHYCYSGTSIISPLFHISQFYRTNDKTNLLFHQPFCVSGKNENEWNSR